MIYLVEITAATDSAGTTTVLRYSSTGYTTKPSDSPANTHYDARVITPAIITRNLFSNGTTSGESRVGYGVVELTNTDGGLDAILPYSFDGRSLVIKTGNDGDDYSAFTTILSGTMEQVEFTFSKVTILARDKLAVLDRPLQTTLYTGTNLLVHPWTGVEGIVGDIKNQPKPLLYGQVINITPVLVNNVLLVYQVNDGAIASIDGVYEGGHAVTFHADFATNALLQAATIPSGQYGTCIAEGYFRLGSNPTYEITCDATQGATSANRTTAQIIKALAIKGGISSGDIVAADVTALDTANSCIIGAWINGLDSTISIIDQVAHSIGAYYGFDAIGQFRMGQFLAPTGTADFVINDSNILSIEHNRTSDTDRGIPAWRMVLRYKKNYTVQTVDLDNSITIDRLNALSQDYLVQTAEDSSIKTKYLLASELQRDSLIISQTQAATEATRLLNLYKVARDLYQVRVALDLTETLPDLNGVAQITLNRFGLDSGKLFRIIGIESDYASNRATLTLWG